MKSHTRTNNGKVLPILPCCVETFSLCSSDELQFTQQTEICVDLVQNRIDLMQLLINSHKEPGTEDAEHDTDFKEIHKGLTKRRMWNYSRLRN